jgi:hypothetical protein
MMAKTLRDDQDSCALSLLWLKLACHGCFACK